MKSKKVYIITFILILILILFSFYNEEHFFYSSQNNSQHKNTSNKEENKLENTDKPDTITDSDGDTISDYDEINTYKSNPVKSDSDNDGIPDNEEIKQKTSPITEDTDGDGLLDGKAIYLNNKIIAPIDPNPTVINGKKGIWQKQIEIEKKGNIPYYLTTFYEYNPTLNNLSPITDINWNQLLTSPNILNQLIQSPQIKSISSKFLNFRLDNGGIILHSQTKEDIYNYIMSNAKNKLPSTNYLLFENTIKTLKINETLETWQKQFGYNQLYDEVFKIATNNNMRSSQLYFQDSTGNQYVIWIWKGYYLSLGSGAEIGIYKKSTSTNNHWEAITFEVPMTLNLYNYYKQNNIEHLFSWKPTNKQWWITGFNPNKQNVDVTKQVLLGTINLSQHKDMYNSLKKLNSTNSSLIFDDNNYTVWINW